MKLKRMSKTKTSTYKILVAMGILSTLAGIYQLYVGKEFSEYFFSIFIGISLAGAAYFSREKFNK
jgi:hypothetical protein